MFPEVKGDVSRSLWESEREESKGSAVDLWYSRAIDALILLERVLQQYLKMRSSFPPVIHESICSAKRLWYHDVTQDMTSISSDDIIAITCAMPNHPWGGSADADGKVIAPAITITKTLHPESFLSACVSGEMRVENLVLWLMRWNDCQRTSMQIGSSLAASGECVWVIVTWRQAQTEKGVQVLGLLVIAAATAYF